MEINKKGIFLTLFFLVLALIIMFNLLVTWKQELREKEDKETLRLLIINDFIKNFDSDLKKASYVATFRSFLALEDYIATRGYFFENLEPYFKEVFTNGTINGTFMEIMNESYLNYYLEKVSSKANLMGIFLNVTVLNVTIKQKDPWTITTNLTVEVLVKDKKEAIKWEYTKNISSDVPIEGLRDPLFSVNSEGRLFRTVRKNIYNEFVVGGNASNLEDFINSGYYIENPDAPNFIMRFTNNLSPDVNGIESLVNLQDFYDQDLYVNTGKSIVDHIYFDNTTVTSPRICNIEGLPSWVKIDLNHNTTYEINELNYSVC